jgi:hypothetical protein
VVGSVALAKRSGERPETPSPLVGAAGDASSDVDRPGRSTPAIDSRDARASAEGESVP